MRSVFRAALLLPLFVAFSSCEKVKQIADLAKKSNAKSAAADGSAGDGGVTEQQFAEITRQPGKVVLVDFTATWCGPCQLMAPMLDKIVEANQGSVVLTKVDVDKSPALAKREGVSGIPDVRVFVNGKQVDRIVGVAPEEELRSRISKQIGNLGEAGTAGGQASPIAPATKDWMPKGMQRR